MEEFNKPFAFSFDRESGFRGAFATREAAVEAGQEAARERSTPIDAIYVGKRVPVDPQADGHAECIVKAMRERMLGKCGVTDYLSKANEHLMADLDAQLAATIAVWLRRHAMLPAARISSISEHPLPMAREHPIDRSGRELSLIGGEE